MYWHMQTLIFKCRRNCILNFDLKDPLILKTKQRDHSVSIWYLVPVLQESFWCIIWHRWHNETEEVTETDWEGRAGTGVVQKRTSIGRWKKKNVNLTKYILANRIKLCESSIRYNFFVLVSVNVSAFEKWG